MDTVKLEGKGFERIAEEGAVSKSRRSIVKYDYDFLKANAQSIITPVIISNSDDYSSLNPVESGKAVAGATITPDAVGSICNSISYHFLCKNFIRHF